jgi:hypothetical protein
LSFTFLTAICAEPGPIDPRWFAKGELYWKRLPTNKGFVPDGDRAVLAIIHDGALGDVCYATHPNGYAPATLAVDSFNAGGSGLKIVVDDAHAGPRMTGGHIFSTSEYDVVHLQFRD